MLNVEAAESNSKGVGVSEQSQEQEQRKNCRFQWTGSSVWIGAPDPSKEAVDQDCTKAVWQEQQLPETVWPVRRWRWSMEMLGMSVKRRHSILTRRTVLPPRDHYLTTLVDRRAQANQMVLHASMKDALTERPRICQEGYISVCYLQEVWGRILHCLITSTTCQTLGFVNTTHLLTL